MGAVGLQPQPEGEAIDPSVSFVRVSPERLAEFDRLVAGDGITAVVAALDRERLERESGKFANFTPPGARNQGAAAQTFNRGE